LARVLITGSSAGLGRLAAQLLLEQGHAVVLHARDGSRAEETLRDVSGACDVTVGDLSSLAGMRKVAEQANALGPFDAVIHNAGIGYREPRRIATLDGLPHVLAVNVLAPYVLTALIARPKRLVYLSSGMHHRAEPALHDLLWTHRPWQGAQAYAESKLYDTALAFAIARLWPDVLSNALEPGWVPTRMGGPRAPDDMDQAHLTQAWLATSEEPSAQVTAGYFYHLRTREPNPVTRDERLQEALLGACAELSGVVLRG
jgi:NAD(P)-dependent dehydrogenase (short-subunit alcohol dehydrogenase family)